MVRGRKRIVLVVQNRAIRTRNETSTETVPSRWIRNERAVWKRTHRHQPHRTFAKTIHSHIETNRKRTHWMKKEMTKRGNETATTHETGKRTIKVECISFLFIQDTRMEIIEKQNIWYCLLRYVTNKNEEKRKKKIGLVNFIVFQY